MKRKMSQSVARGNNCRRFLCHADFLPISLVWMLNNEYKALDISTFLDELF